MKITTLVTGILVPLMFNSVQCRITSKPNNTAAKVGDFVIMRCSSSYVNDTCGSIVWKHFKPNSSSGDYLYTNDQLSPLFTSYISIINSRAGNCDLRINATPSTAGEYQCIDSDSGYTNTSAALIVLENVPEVKFINQSSDSKVMTDLECSVNYYGKWAPQVQWVKIAGNSWTNVTETGSKIMNTPVLSLIQFSSTIQIPKDGATEHFICYVTISTITWRSLECPAGRNNATKVEEPVPVLLTKAYNDGRVHGIGIGFVIGFIICLCLCGIIFLLRKHFANVHRERDARARERAEETESALQGV